MTKCMKCGKAIDLSHDSYFFCDCGGKKKVLCLRHSSNLPRCPECRKRWKHHGSSITKKLFGDSPGQRNLLGF